MKSCIWRLERRSSSWRCSALLSPMLFPLAWRAMELGNGTNVLAHFGGIGVPWNRLKFLFKECGMRGDGAGSEKTIGTSRWSTAERWKA